MDLETGEAVQITEGDRLDDYGGMFSCRRSLYILSSGRHRLEA